MIKKNLKGQITVNKIVLIVVGISVMAVTMMTIKGAIDSAYMKALEKALQG